MGASKFIVPVLAAILAALVATCMSGFILTSPLDASSSSSPSGPVIHTSKRSIKLDGLAFPTDMKIAGSMHSLIGGGSRSKWGFRVYAVGIYGDSKLLKSLKKKYYVGKHSNSLDADASSRLAYEFSHSEQARTLLLRFHRQVPASDMAEALGEALVDKIGKKQSDTFAAFILGIVGRKGDVIKKGTDLYITCKGGKLRVSVGEGKDVDKINMKGLCPSVFRVYLGEKPVSPQAKEGFEKGFDSIV